MDSEQSDQPSVEVEFRFSATSEAKTVSVAGAFNGWSVEADPLARGADGVWSTRLRLPPGRHAYRFVVDGGRWENDAEADAYEPNELGEENSVRIVGSTDGDLHGAADAEARAIAANTSAGELKPDTELVAPSTNASSRESRSSNRTGSDDRGAPAESPAESGDQRTFQQGSGQPSPSIGEQQQRVRPTH